MDVWNQVKDTPMDIVVLNDELNRKRNGGKSVQSCAFSREWNKRYQEEASFECDIDERFAFTDNLKKAFLNGDTILKKIVLNI